MIIGLELHNVLIIIGTGILSVIISAAGTSYAVFRYLGKSWIDQQFKKQFENFKHNKRKEIEKIR